MEQFDALKTENESLKEVIKTLKAEKTALDQMYTSGVREILALRTQAIVLDDKLKKMDADLLELKNKIAFYDKATLSVVQDEAC